MKTTQSQNLSLEEFRQRISQPQAPSKTNRFWDLLRRALPVSVLGALFVSLWQYETGYHDKMAAIAQEDATAATNTLNGTLTTISNAILLQQRLVSDFYLTLKTNKLTQNASYETTEAQSIYKNYINAYADFSQNYSILPLKMTLYIDWPTDGTISLPSDKPPTNSDPVSMSSLGEFNFDCEGNMPTFTPNHTLVLTANDRSLTIDWNNAADQVVAIEYCFDVTHVETLALQQWASSGSIPPQLMDYMTKNAFLFQSGRPVSQASRISALMRLAMLKIGLLRVQSLPYTLLESIRCIFPSTQCR
jgi:hypothetical protein